MPDTLSAKAVLALFYLAFLGQIVLVSLYYPGKLARRIAYVLDNFPQDQYPKLYPASSLIHGKGARRRLRLYSWVNYGIAAVGLAIMAAMAVSGYLPNPLGGDEVFVMMYFALQVSPLLYLSFKEYATYRMMRQAFTRTMRTADFSPRRLFDFISPAYVIAAILLYGLWLAFYLSGRAGGPWEPEVWITLVLISGMNLLYAGVAWQFIYGRKLDPYKAHADQLKQIESTVKVFVFSSIAISVFLMMTHAADRFALEVFDPPLTSLYIQLLVVLGVGVSLRTESIETIDFEVYREDAAQPIAPDHFCAMEM